MLIWKIITSSFKMRCIGCSHTYQSVPSEGAKRRHALAKGRAFKRTLTDLITDIGGSSYQDWLVRATSIGPWIMFMQGCLPACVEAEIAKRNANAPEDAPAVVESDKGIVVVSP
jgi:hypothetical protein